MAVEPLVELVGIGKQFGGVTALAGIDLELMPAKIHALIGENGAGKSTLGKIIAGVHRADGGTMRVRGEEVSFRSPHAALERGIAGIAQEIALVPGRSVIENIFLGIEPRTLGVVRKRRLRKRFDELEARAGFDLDPVAKVGTLPLADQQRVEILRALARESSIVVMDEPSAALPGDDVEKLLSLAERLRDEGIAIVYVSHRLKEILRIADQITVLKDGKLVKHVAAADEDQKSLVRSMLGRDLKQTFPAKGFGSPDAPVVLSVSGLSGRTGPTGIDLVVREGEIVGLAGLVGAGRTEVARMIFGIDPPERGKVELDGADVTGKSTRQLIDRGLVYLPESRKTEGLVMERSIRENVTLARLRELSHFGLIRRREEDKRCRASLVEVSATAGRDGAPVWTLSGGNQQKVLFARWLFERPRLLIVDEPTRGIDVGAKLTIYKLLADLAREGLAILLISSEQEEIVGLSHRVLVMREGRIAAELAQEEINEAGIVAKAFATEEVGSVSANSVTTSEAGR